MNRNYIILLTLLGFLAISPQANGQSLGGDYYRNANKLLKRGNCNDAREANWLYQKAKEADPNLRIDCDKRIQECMQIIKRYCDVPLELSTSQIEIPYQGGDSQIGVNSSKTWEIDGDNSWCNTKTYDKNKFVVQCREPNNSIKERTTTLLIKSGSLFKSLKVIQAARPEYLEVDATSLSFPSEGTKEQVAVHSNADWTIDWEKSEIPTWCKVEKGDDAIHIVVTPNDLLRERLANIVIATSSKKSVTIKINQGAGEEHLALSQNNIVIPSEGGKHFVKIYTDAGNWLVGDFPNWMNVTQVGIDSICIECGKNIPNGQERSGSVLIRTDRQTAGVMVTQAARMPQDIIFPDSKIVGGQNVSLGISASYYMPFISTSAGGNYVGSVVDYSLGSNAENAAYTSATGFSLGLFADIRLYKNIFLTAGVHFTQVKYENRFNQPITYTSALSSYQYLRGEVQNSYEEDYKHYMIEVPILASYRFKTGDVSHIQFNLGPVLNFGISSKMELFGTTDGDMLRKYNTATNKQADNANYVHHTSATTNFNLYQPCVLWTESYTTGNVQEIQHHDVFSESPIHRINLGLRVGAAYEISGIQFGISYTLMLSNMANQGYWENKRFSILNESQAVITGYKQHINALEFKLAYTLRYFKLK